VPAAFGSELAEAAPQRLLTPVADTAFSRGRLLGLVTGSATPPGTVPELRAEDVALQGLSALEALMLEGPIIRSVPLARRCALATTVAGNVQAVAAGLARTWRDGPVADHWRGDAAELADRLRLRDLVQGMISAVVRLNRDVSQLLANPGANPELPFADAGAAILYLDGLAAGIISQAALLRQTEGAAADEAFALLSSIMSALEEGRRALLDIKGDDTPASLALPFAQVQGAVLDRLPVALGFDTTAFELPPAVVAEETN
jgi:hypothetical protein